MDDLSLRDATLEAAIALAAHGMGTGIGGHVSMRVPGTDRYWTNILDRTFEEMTEEDIVLLEADGTPVSADRPISPAISFHGGIYSLRPDVNGIVHSHGYWMTAQSAYGRPPKMWHNLSTFFYERTAISPGEDFDSIAPALGPRDVAIVMPWHGAITLGPTIGDAAALHVTFDYACRLDLDLSGSSAPEMPEAECLSMRRILEEEADYLSLTWELMRRKGRQFRARRDGPAPRG